MDYESIKSHFNVKKNGKQTCSAICPCHEDREPSLSISYDSKDSKTLVYCHAGCGTREILEKVGLKMKDLFDKEGA